MKKKTSTLITELKLYLSEENYRSGKTPIHSDSATISFCEQLENRILNLVLIKCSLSEKH